VATVSFSASQWTRGSSPANRRSVSDGLSVGRSRPATHQGRKVQSAWRKRPVVPSSSSSMRCSRPLAAVSGSMSPWPPVMCTEEQTFTAQKPLHQGQRRAGERMFVRPPPGRGRCGPNNVAGANGAESAAITSNCPLRYFRFFRLQRPLLPSNFTVSFAILSDTRCMRS